MLQLLTIFVLGRCVVGRGSDGADQTGDRQEPGQRDATGPCCLTRPAAVTAIGWRQTDQDE